MITIEEQQGLLLSIGKKLKKKVAAYAVGGTAMMLSGMKDATVDTDLVFDNENDRKIFKESLKELGYREMDSVIVYGGKKNHPEMMRLGSIRFDLFVSTVISFDFSDSMKKRAEVVHEFGEKFILRVADMHDIILMKCATDRMKDIDDARNIIASKKIDWNIIIGEAKEQIKLGREMAAFELGFFLEKLKRELKVDIPEKVLNEIFSIVEKQAESKRKIH